MAIPIAYLMFKGQCRDALNLYTNALGGKIARIHRYGDAPKSDGMPTAPDDNWIMHSQIEWPDGGTLMASDSCMLDEVNFKGIRLSLNFASVAEGERVFNALSVGGTVEMPFQKTFWSAGFGQLRDKFGVGWMVNVTET